MVFSRKPKLLVNLETTPAFKVSGTFKDYYNLLNKRLQQLHKLLQEFKSKRLAMLNKDKTFFQYNRGDLVYIILPPTSQLHTISRKVMFSVELGSHFSQKHKISLLKTSFCQLSNMASSGPAENAYIHIFGVIWENVFPLILFDGKGKNIFPNNTKKLWI